MNQIETNELFKAAYLLTKSCKIKETKFVNDEQVRFVIEGENLFEEDELYHTGKARVDPVHLKECLNYLRNRLTEILRTQNSKRRTNGKDTGRRITSIK